MSGRTLSVRSIRRNLLGNTSHLRGALQDGGLETRRQRNGGLALRHGGGDTPLRKSGGGFVRCLGGLSRGVSGDDAGGGGGGCGL